jgi:hypothetical protein
VKKNSLSINANTESSASGSNKKVGTKSVIRASFQKQWRLKDFKFVV